MPSFSPPMPSPPPLPPLPPLPSEAKMMNRWLDSDFGVVVGVVVVDGDDRDDRFTLILFSGVIL